MAASSAQAARLQGCTSWTATRRHLAAGRRRLSAPTPPGSLTEQCGVAKLDHLLDVLRTPARIGDAVAPLAEPAMQRQVFLFEARPFLGFLLEDLLIDLFESP